MTWCFSKIRFRINRNILECKERRQQKQAGGSQSINRNILECKDRDGQKIYTTDVVLIETYWNVKKV